MGFLSKLFDREIKDTPTEPPVNNSINGKFHMEVEDVFTITGRGTVVTGRVDSGEIHVGETVIISGKVNTEVIGIEMFRKKTDYAKAGDACGIYLKDISRNEIHSGDYLEK